MTLYEQYCQARIDCGYDDGFQMRQAVWEACDIADMGCADAVLESQQSMVAQMQKGAREIARVRAQHEAYRLRYGETW